MTDFMFKQCPKCGVWFSIEDIMESPQIKPIGMTFDDANLTINIFYFNHIVKNCETTFAIKVEKFKSFLKEAEIAVINTGTSTCEGRCLDISDHGLCTQACKYAPYRRLLHEMMTGRKSMPQS